MRRLSIAVSTISLVLLVGSGAARADSCAAIASQMRVAASASNSKTAQIHRQIAAIRAIERQRSCTAEKAAAGGFFNACRGLARQRADAERELASAKSSGGNHLKARYEALGCETHSRPVQERLVKPKTPEPSGFRYAGDALYYCVRPSDGYFFPAPNSQFAKRDYAEVAVDQCRFICEDRTMALYVLEDPELESEGMVSVEAKTPYGELPAAFRYQDEKYKTCNWPRYFARINELRARTVTPRNLENAIIPPPTSRPDQQDPLQTSAYKAETDLESVHRKVRTVGTRFLSDRRINFRELSDRSSKQNGLFKTFEVLTRMR